MNKTARIRLSEARKQRSWSQQELAARLGTTRHNISRWEAGLTTPGPYFRAKLCELFGKTAQELGLIALNSGSSTPAEKEATTTQAVSPQKTDVHALWTVPYGRNPLFTGRDELLTRLDQQFFPAKNSAATLPRRAALTQPQALKGLGGIGKTQIAVEYAYRAREQGRFTHILWINAASEEALLSSFVTLADLLPNFAAREETDQHKLVKAIKGWLEECPQPWLLIFDNADEFSLLHPYLPGRGNGSLLLTTRSHAVGSLAASIEVENMGLVEGALLLLHRTQRQQASDEERNEATNVVIALDGFPLALDQAGAYIEETGCSFADYLQTYQEHHQALLARRGRQATNYPDSVATTWSLSFRKVEESNPAAAAELLHLCAFLAPDAIPEELLVQGAAFWPPALQQAVANSLSFNQALADLLRFSLIKRLVEQRQISLHRLVQVVQRDTLTMEEQREWAERVVRTVHGVFPADPKEDVASWPQCLRYLEQAQGCYTLIQEYELLLPEAAELLDRAGMYLSTHASYSLAEPLYQRAIQIWEKRVGPEHPQVAFPLTNLARLSLLQGKFEQAQLLYQRALSIREQHFGPQHPLLALPLNGLANIYYHQGNYEQVERVYRRVLSIREQHFGPQHPQVASQIKNLALLYVKQGRYAEAELLFQRALSIQQQLGETHPDLVSVLKGLADLYREQERFAEAEPLFQRVLALQEQRLGETHPDLAYALNGLAQVYNAQDRYAEAKPLYQRAQVLWEQQLGETHQLVAFPLAGLAALSLKQGKYRQAEALFQRVLVIWERDLGPEHSLVASTLAWLVKIYQEQGRATEAEPLLQRVLSIYERRPQEQPLLMAQALDHLAAFRERQGKHQEAAVLYQRALGIREEILGVEHPRTVEAHERLQAMLFVLEHSAEE